MNQFRWMLALTMCLWLTSAVHVYAAMFHCPSGDVACLTQSILTANANGEVNVINLAAGVYTISVPYTHGIEATALPDITSALTIQGVSATTTVIERDPSLPFTFDTIFRLLLVSQAGDLTLRHLTLQDGVASVKSGGGGSIASQGRLALIDTVIKRNSTSSNFGGGVASFGILRMHRSTVTENFSESFAGLWIGGEALITESAIIYNRGAWTSGGFFIGDGARVTIENSTIASNSAINGAALVNRGMLALDNVTVAHNVGGAGGIGGFVNEGEARLVNTIIAGNRHTGSAAASDCRGFITSAGHNLIGDPTGCDIALQPTDRTGDPGFDAFVDAAQPGRSHFPLLAHSQAIDAGDDDACPATDQLGHPRVGPCDIGAIEFQGPREPPAVALHMSMNPFIAGETLQVFVERSIGPEDLHVAILMPDGVTTLFFTSLESLSYLVSTIAQGPYPVTGGLTLDYTWHGLEPTGTYHIVAALAKPGSLADGVIHEGDLLALDWAPIMLQPAPVVATVRGISPR